MKILLLLLILVPIVLVILLMFVLSWLREVAKRFFGLSDSDPSSHHQQHAHSMENERAEGDKQKVFDDDEGEYVDFVDIEEKGKSDKKH